MSKKRYAITASAFDKRGRCIYTSGNSYSDSSSLMRYYAMKSGHPLKVFNHAEIACIYHASVRLRQKIHKLVVLRFDCTGALKNSKPCPVCDYAIKDMGIKEVYYSTPEGMVRLVN